MRSRRGTSNQSRETGSLERQVDSIHPKSKKKHNSPEFYMHKSIKVKFLKIPKHIKRVARYNTRHLVKFESQINNEQILV